MMDAEEIAYSKLPGTFKHYCCEWDGLAIDEGCPEFKYCHCEWDDLTPEQVQQLKQLRGQP